MMRTWELPEKRPDEDGFAWCERVAASIPAEDLMRVIIAYLDKKAKRSRFPAWSVIGELTGHGSGVSEAICRRFRTEPTRGGLEMLRLSRILEIIRRRPIEPPRSPEPTPKVRRVAVIDGHGDTVTVGFYWADADDVLTEMSETRYANGVTIGMLLRDGWEIRRV